MKKYVLLLVSIFLIASGCKEESINTANLSITKNNQQANTAAIVSPTSTTTFTYSTVTLEDNQDGYYYEIEYPVFSGGDEKIRGKMNQDVYGQVQSDLNSFLDDFNTTDHDYDPGPWFLEISYYVNRNDDAFVSIIMNVSIYTGGAHPNSYTNTLNFNLEEGGHLMSLADVFNPVATQVNSSTGEKQDYMEFISEYVINELLKNGVSDEDWIRAGAAADETNYQNFYFTDYEIVFIFDPYQVAPYAAGPQEVAIPFEDLAGYLRAYAF